MEKNTSSKGKKSLIATTLDNISGFDKAPNGAFLLIIVLYFITAFTITKIARTSGDVCILGVDAPISAFVGVFSAVANMLVIFLVVFFKKKGFYAALLILIGQFPMLFITILRWGNVVSIPGIFTNIFTIIAIFLLYANNLRVDRYQERLRDQAVTDRLTRLPNRFACTELVEELIRRNERFTFVSMDINNFKSINDTMGHDTGNSVLIEIAHRLMNTADSDSTGTLDFVTRQGGDEFSLIIRGYRSDDEVLKTIRYYESVIEKKMTIDQCDYFITSSFGYASFPQDAKDIDSLFACADAAMYEVKRTNSSDRIIRFSPEHLRIGRTLEIERTIRNALENDSVTFALQPQFDLNHKLRGFEALARLSGSELKPVDFIPVAEKVGIIDKLDACVIKKSTAFFGELLKKTGADITLSVNVSVRHMMKNNFISELADIINKCGIPSNQLELEITESVMIDSADKALDRINEIKSMGIMIAIDDFGTGYSSLSYLNKFPANLLKIDKSFIDKLNSSDSSNQYVAAIISIGHIMDLEVISEGVENADQLDTLRECGCDYVQGFIWGKPLCQEDAEQLVFGSMYR